MVVQRVAVYVVHDLENPRQGVGHELLGNDSVAEVPIALSVPPKDKLIVPRTWVTLISRFPRRVTS